MKKYEKYCYKINRCLSKLSLIGRLAPVLCVVTMVFTSCKVQQYHFIAGEWQQDIKQHSLVNEEKGCTFVYNLDELNYTLPENILLISETVSPVDKSFRPDKFSQSILKKVNYNPKTDSIYFILQGHLIVFSSPEFNLHTASCYIDLTRIVKDEHPNPSIDWYTEESVMDHYIYRTIYHSRKKKQYLVKDVFRWREEYINMVYIYQSQTKANRETSPRIWRTSYDVTDPMNVIYVGRLISKHNRISIRNTLRNR